MTDTMLSFAETVQARHSVRAFRSDPVPESMLHQVLADAQRAPSNCNTQPWDVHIVSGASRDRLSRALHGASEGGQLSPDFFRDETAFPGVYGDRRRAQGKVYYENLGMRRDDAEARRRASARNFSFFNAPSSRSAVPACRRRWSPLSSTLKKLSKGMSASGQLIIVATIIASIPHSAARPR